MSASASSAPPQLDPKMDNKHNKTNKGSGGEKPSAPGAAASLLSSPLQKLTKFELRRIAMDKRREHGVAKGEIPLHKPWYTAQNNKAMHALITDPRVYPPTASPIDPKFGLLDMIYRFHDDLDDWKQRLVTQVSAMVAREVDTLASSAPHSAWARELFIMAGLTVLPTDSIEATMSKFQARRTEIAAGSYITGNFYTFMAMSRMLIEAWGKYKRRVELATTPWMNASVIHPPGGPDGEWYKKVTWGTLWDNPRWQWLVARWAQQLGHAPNPLDEFRSMWLLGAEVGSPPDQWSSSVAEALTQRDRRMTVFYTKFGLGEGVTLVRHIGECVDCISNSCVLNIWYTASSHRYQMNPATLNALTAIRRSLVNKGGAGPLKGSEYEPFFDTAWAQIRENHEVSSISNMGYLEFMVGGAQYLPPFPMAERKVPMVAAASSSADVKAAAATSEYARQRLAPWTCETRLEASNVMALKRTTDELLASMWAQYEEDKAAVPQEHTSISTFYLSMRSRYLMHVAPFLLAQ